MSNMTTEAAAAAAAAAANSSSNDCDLLRNNANWSSIGKSATSESCFNQVECCRSAAAANNSKKDCSTENLAPTEKDVENDISSNWTRKKEKKPSISSSGRSKNKKSSWYNALYPTYKSRSEDFKRIFKDIPTDERLVLDYSCALQREILAHGRLYVSQNYLCFYANIFTWETLVTISWKNVTSITKEKTALIIPNAILVSTESEKFFFTSFLSRNKVYLMLFRIWQNALIGQTMTTNQVWQLVHSSYGEELGLTTDDEDYITSKSEFKQVTSRLSIESTSETDSILVDQVYTSSPKAVQQQQQEASDNSEDSTESEMETGSKYSFQMLLKYYNNNVRNSVECTASHQGRTLVDIILPINVDQLFTLLFMSSQFFLDFQLARKTKDLAQSVWTEDTETGQKTRTITLTAALTQTIGPKTSQVTEIQILQPCSKPGRLYSIDSDSTNCGIPYSDTFSVETHFCLKRISKTKTSLQVFCRINYKKNAWALVKTFIDKNCWVGLEDYFSHLVKLLTIECESMNATTQDTKMQTRLVTESTIGVKSSCSEILTRKPITKVASASTRKNYVIGALRMDAGLMSWVLLLAVFILLLLNSLLYYKLWRLEDVASYTVMDLHALKDAPKTEEDWINLLQHQENFHNVEMKKWQRILSTATRLLRQTEDALTELQMSIHPTTTDKQFSVLKSRFQSQGSDKTEEL